MGSSLDLIRRLTEQGVDFVLVGGMAGVVHGSSLVTRDVDVCAPFTESNMGRLLGAVRDLNPRHSRAPGAPPLRETPSDLAGTSELSLTTDLGRLDVLEEIPGVGSWPDVTAAAQDVDLGAGLRCRVLGIDALIQSKRFLGRTRDLLAVEELEEIRRRLRDGR